MSQVSDTMRRVDGGHMHWCPGCKEVHLVPDSWTFNNNYGAPSFQPSVKHTWTYGPEKVANCCHYFITDGRIAFCGDCTHSLAGQSVTMAPLPEYLCDEARGGERG